MKEADIDGDDHITYEEFVRLMMTHWYNYIYKDSKHSIRFGLTVVLK